MLHTTAQEDEDDPFPGTSEEGPHFRIRDVFTSHHSDSGYDHGYVCVCGVCHWLSHCVGGVCAHWLSHCVGDVCVCVCVYRVPVDVTHYIQDKSLRHRLVLLSLSNSKLGKLFAEQHLPMYTSPQYTGIRMLLLRAIFLLLGCLLYVAETVYYDYFTANGAGLYQDSLNTTDTLEIIALQ